ncbi:MAG: DUF4112 domain-containing protein [Gemmatimonadaceae bacterium]
MTSTVPPRGRAVSGRAPGLEGARAAARLLDEAIRIPGTNVRVGLDPILGIIPGLGDVLGGAMSGYLILLASRHGAPRSVLLRMLGNVLVDSVAGAVPLLGDLFDVGWKSNTRNLALLDRYLEQPQKVRTSSRALVALILLVLALAVVGGVALAVWVVRAVVGAAT